MLICVPRRLTLHFIKAHIMQHFLFMHQVMQLCALQLSTFKGYQPRCFPKLDQKTAQLQSGTCSHCRCSHQGYGGQWRSGSPGLAWALWWTQTQTGALLSMWGHSHCILSLLAVSRPRCALLRMGGNCWYNVWVLKSVKYIWPFSELAISKVYPPLTHPPWFPLKKYDDPGNRFLWLSLCTWYALD